MSSAQTTQTGFVNIHDDRPASIGRWLGWAYAVTTYPNASGSSHSSRTQADFQGLRPCTERQGGRLRTRAQPVRATLSRRTATDRRSLIRVAKDFDERAGNEISRSLAPVVGAGTLLRLRELDTGGLPVLSAYLDLARESTRASEIPGDAVERLCEDVGRPECGDGMRRVGEFLRSAPRFAGGTRGLAMFAASGGAPFEVVALPCAVQTAAVVDPVPWLEPLTGMISSGDRGVAVIGRRAQRLFRGDRRVLAEFACVHAAAASTPEFGSRSGSEVRALACSDRVERIRQALTLLARAHRRRPFEQLVIAAPPEFWTTIESTLHDDLRSLPAARLSDDLDLASAEQIARAASVAALADPWQRRNGGCSTSTASSPRDFRMVVGA